MIEFFQQNFWFFLIALFFFFSLIINLIFIFHLRKKERSLELKSFPSDAIFLKFSEDLKKEIESLVKIQVERFYRELLTSIFPEMRSSILLNSEKFAKQLDFLTEEAKKEVLKSKELIQSVYQDLLSENKKNLEKISQSFLSETKEKIKSISEKLEKESLKTLTETKQNFEKKLIDLERDLEKIKKEKLEEIEKNIYKILSDVAKKTLGKAIDLTTHEELVMEALKKAKKENLFEL